MKTRKKLLGVIVLGVLVGCAGPRSYYVYNVDYDFQMRVADRKTGSEDLKTNIGEIGKKSDYAYAFQDSPLFFIIAPSSKKFTVFMRTEAGESLQLQQDSIAFIDVRGRFHPVDFGKLTWREWTNHPVANAHEYQISGNVYPLGERSGERKSAGMFSGRDNTGIGLVSPQFGAVQDTIPDNDSLRISIQSYLNSEASQNVGRMIGLILPVRMNETRYRYTFWFEIRDYRIRSPKLTQVKSGIF